MPRLVALKSWSGRNAGEEFDATDADARILCAPDGLGGQRARYVDRVMRTDDAVAEAASAPTDKTERRRYLRRDLRAQN